ncbi:MAG: hypothetical protein CENE_00605 [Candidatus Celerinatantimonas neptuna]|nr:MAG: hypothetical protein CENE_00605 [Candidatus Celerinatantimonas neptuna]
MISIEKYTEDKYQDVVALSVKPEQVIFTVGSMADVIAYLESHEHPHLIVASGQVAGFFILDIKYAEHYDFCHEKALGIRALMIDQKFQRQKIAKQALLNFPAYAQEFYPRYDDFYLTVNCRNKPAYQCYINSVFTDTGELYTGGPAGPQHIMMRHIRVQ